VNVVEIPFASNKPIGKGGNKIAIAAKFPIFDGSGFSIGLGLQVSITWSAGHLEAMSKRVARIVIGFAALLEEFAVESDVTGEIVPKGLCRVLDAIVSNVDAL
jgi:hypothetical protein